MKPFSEACERNKEPILSVLREAFADRRSVLEIGSGTGQHALHFARGLPHLTWQPSDVAANLPGLQASCGDARPSNLHTPIALDLDQDWPALTYDAVFSANTLHIVSWPQVERLFVHATARLPARGVLAIYGPFNYAGQYTAESNARFDHMLRARDPHSGIRDFEAVDALAREQGLMLERDQAMPANNRTLIWRSTREITRA